MFRRILFLALAVALGLGGGWLFRRFVPQQRVDAGIIFPSENVARNFAPPPVIEASHSPLQEKAAAVAEAPHPVGYVARGRRVNVVMSDGTVRTERDKELETLERNSVTLDGQKLFIRASGPGSGAKGAPVRQDGVPPAAAIAGRIGDASPPPLGTVAHPSPPLQKQSELPSVAVAAR